jgi:hypothetical protein
MKKLHVVPKSTFDISEFLKDMSNVADSFNSLSDSNKRGCNAFFDGIINDLKEIMASEVSSAQKQRELILYKQKLQFKKAPPAYEYQIKRIDEAIIKYVEPTIKDLYELIRLEREFGISNQNPTIKKEVIEIAIKTPLNQLNSNLSELSIDDQSLKQYKKIKMNMPMGNVYAHFMKLINFKNELNNKPYLSKDNVEQLLAQAFEGYSISEVKQEQLNLNLTNKQFAIFYTFIYQFYYLNETNKAGTKMKYAYFLKDNFLNFSRLDIKTLYSSIRLNTELVKSIDLLKAQTRN